MRVRKRLRSNDIALVGIVMVAFGIAALTGAAPLVDRLLLAGGLWIGALLLFAVARRPGR